MSYFIYGKSDLKRLADAYEDLVSELEVVYYNQDGEAIEAAQKVIGGLWDEYDLDDHYVSD